MGRPKIGDEDKKVKTNITLQKWHLEALKELGQGNVSRGVRKLVEFFKVDEKG